MNQLAMPRAKSIRTSWLCSMRLDFTLGFMMRQTSGSERPAANQAGETQASICHAMARQAPHDHIREHGR
jgi:hypothetical protein